VKCHSFRWRSTCFICPHLPSVYVSILAPRRFQDQFPVMSSGKNGYLQFISKYKTCNSILHLVVYSAGSLEYVSYFHSSQRFFLRVFISATLLFCCLFGYFKARYSTSICTVYRLEMELSFRLSLFLSLSLSRYMFRQ
jgi:hypothetical protein